MITRERERADHNVPYSPTSLHVRPSLGLAKIERLFGMRFVDNAVFPDRYRSTGSKIFVQVFFSNDAALRDDISRGLLNIHLV